MKSTSAKKIQLLSATALGIVSAIAVSQAAHASGFGLREGSADWLGNAFSGSEAKAYDASTAWTNPAGMALLDQNQVAGDVSYIGPSAKFSGYNTNALGGNLTGSTGGNSVAPAASGALFGVLILNPNWRLGMSVTNPYGERTSYPSGWVGRYQSLVSSITGVDFSVALSYKVNNHLSIGGGPVVEYFHSRLTQAIHSGALAYGMASHIPNINPLMLGKLAQLPDGAADVHGSDVALGYNLGILYKFDDATRLGIDYHSRIRHNIHGTEILDGVPSLTSPTFETNISTNARTTATVPDSIGASIYHQVTPALALMGSVQWTHWALFNSLHITPGAGGQAMTINENWRNTWFAGIGANYQATDRLMLQTGFSFDESPVTNNNRTSRVPDANHYNLGVGMQYKVLPSTTLQLAYLHVFSPGGTINNTSSAGLATGTQVGSYDASDNSVTAGVNVVF